MHGKKFIQAEAWYGESGYFSGTEQTIYSELEEIVRPRSAQRPISSETTDKKCWVAVLKTEDGEVTWDEMMMKNVLERADISCR